MSYREILQAALALPKPKRAALGKALQDSLEDTKDNGLSPEWLEEVQRRSKEIDEGKVELLTLAQFKRRAERLKKTLRSKR
jgi:putative addiction module component (TIGR02574 family)